MTARRSCTSARCSWRTAVVQAVLDPAKLPARRDGAPPAARRHPRPGLPRPAGEWRRRRHAERRAGRDGLAAIAAAHRRLGTTGILPTLISGSRDLMRRALAATGAAIAAGVPGILGLHLEGPFLNPARHGIHPLEAMLTLSEEDLAILAGPHPFPLMVTLAPECAPPDAVARLAECRGDRLRRAQRRHARSRSAPRSMPGSPASRISTTRCPRSPRARRASSAPRSPRQPRAPGSSWTGCTRIRSRSPPPMRRWGPSGCSSSRMRCPPWAAAATSITLGDTTIRLQDGKLTGPDGTLGGAHLDMATAVRRAVDLARIPLADALRMATATPADCLGLTDRGRLRPGCRADFVVLDEKLRSDRSQDGRAEGLTPPPGLVRDPPARRTS